MSLVATPKGVNSNSYCTVSDADDYLTEQRLYSSVWSTQDTTEKEAALIWATAMLDASFEWAGSKRTLEQALRWPRSGATDLDGNWYDYDTIPVVLRNATAELASYLVANDPSALPDLFGYGFKEVAVGPIKVVLDTKQVLPMIPAYVQMLLRAIGTVLDGISNSGMTQVKLERS